MNEKAGGLWVPYERVFADIETDDGMIVILRPRFDAFKVIADGGFSRDAAIQAAEHYVVKPGGDYYSPDGGGDKFSAERITADALMDMDAFTVIAIADAAIEAIGIANDGDETPEIDGDGYKRPIIYALSRPVKSGDVTVTHLEFHARKYGVMRSVWMADGAGNAIEQFLLKACVPVHDGDDQIPMTGEIISQLDGADLANISAYVLPVFSKGGGKLRKRQTY